MRRRWPAPRGSRRFARHCLPATELLNAPSGRRLRPAVQRRRKAGHRQRVSARLGRVAPGFGKGRQKGGGRSDQRIGPLPDEDEEQERGEDEAGYRGQAGGDGSVARDEMKGKRPFEADFPPALLAPLNFFLDVYRPYLLTLGSEGLPDAAGRLWISNEGRPMDDQSIRNAIKKRTRQAFGRDLTPHLFRDASVTSLIRDAPSSARLAKSILSHQTLEMTNKFYNQAQMVETSRRHAQLIEQLLSAD